LAGIIGSVSEVSEACHVAVSTRLVLSVSQAPRYFNIRKIMMTIAPAKHKIVGDLVTGIFERLFKA
jgi:hypothetical protein